MNTMIIDSSKHTQFLVDGLAQFRNDGLARKEGQIQGLESTLLVATTQLNQVRIEARGQKKQIEELDKELAKLKNDKAALETRVTELQTNQYALEDKLTNANFEKTDLATRIQFLDVRIQKLELELAAKKEEDARVTKLAQLQMKEKDLTTQMAATEGLELSWVLASTKIGAMFGPIGAGIGFVASAGLYIVAAQKQRLGSINELIDTKKQIMLVSGNDQGSSQDSSIQTLISMKDAISAVPNLT